ncbi:MAG TPA: glycosyltransferase [Longimicrobiales bacterium]
MRVVVIGRSRARDVERWIHRALLRAGHIATLVDDRKVFHGLGRRAAGAWVRARVRAFRPHRLIIAKAIGVPVHVLRELCAAIPSVMWYRDLRVPPDPEILERAACVDTTFLTAGGQAPLFEAAGARRALFLPDGVDPEVDRPVPPVPEYECDVAFIGSAGDEHRLAFLARIARRFRVRTWGRGWDAHAREVGWMGRPAYGEDFGRICASARIVLGLDRSFQARERVWGYTSNRLWRVIAAGGFYLGPSAPGLREVVRDGEHCALYDDEEHALALIERYVADDAERDRIRSAGRAFVLTHHTMDHRIHNLLTGAPFRNPLAEEPAA